MNSSPAIVCQIAAQEPETLAQGEDMMYWLNVDYSQRRCTLHTADCTWRQQEETETKGVGRLLDEGGWISFKHSNQARQYYAEEWKPERYAFIRCSNCSA